MTFDCPIVINVRDRVTPLRALVGWLERAGHADIVILDNASTYDPLLAYLAASPHRVHYLGWNFGSRALWYAGFDLLDIDPAAPFVYTDPDIVPTDDCPLDAVARLKELLDRYPDYPKAGLGLYLDDVPATLDPGIVAWERGSAIRGPEVESGAYASAIDTTFALYRPGAGFGYRALRTGPPYEARHMGWYSMCNPTAEDRYYLDHAIKGPMGSSWAEACG